VVLIKGHLSKKSNWVQWEWNCECIRCAWEWIEFESGSK
jgi:hypothetical protein